MCIPLARKLIALTVLCGVVFGFGLRPARAELPSGMARNFTPGETIPPWLQCRRAIQAAGHGAGIPDHLMAAIARVESGRRGADGQVQPWPWTINAEGADHVYETRDQAVAAVRALQAGGMRSIDVGCMQVNLLHHPDAFASLEEAFDPAANATYAAHFLAQLRDQTGSWQKATAYYHSATPETGAAYQQKVMAVLQEESRADATFLGSGLLPPRSRLGIGGMGSGALMLSNRAEAAHVLPMAANAMPRGLDAYRSAPVRVATRK